MSELSKYVDELFAGYPKDRQNEELKAEILGNLEAKKADLVASGMSEPQATQEASESITSVDFLVDGNSQVYLYQLKLEQAQQSIILILIGWILTIPCLMFHLGLLWNGIFFLAVLAFGCYYLWLYQKQSHSTACRSKTAFLSLQKYKRRKKLIWILWGIFAAVSLLANMALSFSSNLWFSRKVTIDGPYALASLLISFLAPMLTIFIPIICSLPIKLIAKYEVGSSNEK